MHRGNQILTIRSQVKRVKRKRQRQIAIGVKAFDKLISLIGEIRTNGKLRFKRSVDLPPDVPIGVEFFIHRFQREVSDMP